MSSGSSASAASRLYSASNADFGCCSGSGGGARLDPAPFLAMVRRSRSPKSTQARVERASPRWPSQLAAVTCHDSKKASVVAALELLVPAKFLSGCIKNCFASLEKHRLQQKSPKVPEKKMLVEAKLLVGCLKNCLPIPLKKKAIATLD